MSDPVAKVTKRALRRAIFRLEQTISDLENQLEAERAKTSALERVVVAERQARKQGA